MLTRRRALARLAGMAGAGAAVLARGVTSAEGKAAQPATPVRIAVPAGACDCHTHVFGDPTRFPFAPARTYTPETAGVDELRALHRALHVDRVVIVQPSVYGTDNACTLDGIRQIGAGARGVAVIDAGTTRAALDELHRGGIRGIRLNLATTGQRDPSAARALFDWAVGRVAPLGWHIQIYTELSVIEALRSHVAAAPVPVVFDHFGGAQARLGTGQPGLRVLADLLESGHAYVKISAPYRSSTQGPDYADVAPLATRLIAANPRRILWGTDWPHPDSSAVPGRRVTDLAPLQQIDDGRVLNQLEAWAPDRTTLTTILVDNPGRLYWS